jgi:UDP-glucose 4-epimerase
MPIDEIERGRVLVLGAGFIGSAIARELVTRGHEVTALSRSARGLQSADGVNLVLGDASEMATLTSFVAETDHVVYALGSSSPAESELDPASDVSAVLQPIIRLLELLRFRPTVTLTFISSGGAVYGNADGAQLAETVTPSPISSYGLLKLTCEKYIQMYAERFGLPARILRVSNAYGPGQSWSGGQGVIAHLMRSAYTGDSVPLYGPEEIVRDFIYIDDIAVVAASLIQRSDGPLIVNVASGIGHSIHDLLTTIEAVSGAHINTQLHRVRSFDVRRNVLDCHVLKSLLPFEPTALPTGLALTWKAAVDSLDHGKPELTARRAPTSVR